MKQKTLISAMALAMGLSSFAGLALAQDNKDKKDTESYDLGQVVVTATKREQSIQDIAFSVMALTEEELRNRGVDSIEDVSLMVAGFTVQNLGPGQSQVAIRGVSAGQIVRDQPGVKEQVGVYLDETPISLSLFTPDLDLFDSQRVEVLRGPQGTLFGAGSLSGTVRYITNQPKLGEIEGAIQGSLETVTDGGIGGDIKGMYNAPTSENSALRVVLYDKEYPGFIDAVQPNGIKEDVNDGYRRGGRIAWKWQPNEVFSIVPRYVFQKVDVNGFNRVDIYNILANPFTTTRPPVQLGSRQQYTQLQEKFTDDFKLFDVTMEYDMDNVTMTSVTSYTKRKILVLRDATQLTASITGGNIGLPPEIYTLDAPLYDRTKARVFTQELRFASNSDGPLNWVAGGFYSDAHRRYGQELLVRGFEDATGIPTAGPLAPRDVLFYSDIPYKLEQFALFGEASYLVTDELTLTGGLRYYDYTEDRTLFFDGIFADQSIDVPATTSADGFSPRIMASYAKDETTTFTAQISKGFRLGGINDPLNEPLCSPEDLATFGGRDSFDDETVINYEVGLKKILSNVSGHINVAAFYMDISDLQATLTAGTCSSRVIFNVPEAHSAGIEFDASFNPTDNLELSFSGSYINAELDSTVTSTDADGNTRVLAGIKEGNRLPTVPKMQFSANGVYFWPMDNGWDGYFSGTISYVGSRYTQIGDQAEGFGTVDLTVYPLGDPSQTTFTFDPELPSYTLVNTRLGFRKNDWDVALYINNLTDEEARLALDQERGTLARVGYLTNQPRTIGIQVRKNF